MPDPTVGESLSAAAADVLETMFFSPVMGEAASGMGEPAPFMAARLQFSGRRCGAFTVRVSESAAQVIAANFLAEETNVPTTEQVREVICELANMICGSVLSRMDRGAHFELGPPALVDAVGTVPPESASRVLDIGDGEVGVFLHMEAQP
jgi:CheY-specific phosphatase CheX